MGSKNGQAQADHSFNDPDNILSLHQVRKHHEIALEFNIESKEHSDIRRSPLTLEDDPLPTETEVDKKADFAGSMTEEKPFLKLRDFQFPEPSHATELNETSKVPSRFDQLMYDFMVPEGKSEKASEMAVVDFITEKGGQQPSFAIAFDKQGWFSVGDVTMEQGENVDVYHAAVLLKALADVRVAETRNGMYKFVVEAKQGETVHTTKLRVDVISLSPTTVRSTTTALLDDSATSVDMILEGSSKFAVPSTPISIAGEPNSTSGPNFDSSASSKIPGAASIADGKVEAPGNKDGTKKSESEISKAFELFLAEKTMENPENENSTNKTTAAATESSFPEKLQKPEKELVDEETSTTSFSEITSLETMSTDSTETFSTMQLTSSEEMKEIFTITTVQIDPQTNSSTTEIFETTTKSVGNDGLSEGSAEVGTQEALAIEGSGMLTESFNSKEENEESPLKGATKIMDLQATSEENDEQNANSIRIEVLGAGENDHFINKDAKLRGDVLREFSLVFNSTERGKSAEIDIEPLGIFSVQPKILFPGEAAYLVLENAKKLGTNQFEVIARTSGGTTARRIFEIETKWEPEQTDTFTEEPENIEMKKVSFEVSEDAPAGATVGKVEGSMRIVGSSDRFVLVGNDIILSCSADKCLDAEKKSRHSLILLPTDGSLAPIEVQVRVKDVNEFAPTIHSSDEIIRISDNRLIMPFGVSVIDKDAESQESSTNQVSVSGSAAAFLRIEKVEKHLYQVMITDSAPSGTYELKITAHDEINEASKRVKVSVENSNSHARFRRSKYLSSLQSGNIRKGEQLTQVELEGVPIDETKIVVLGGNPGWITVEDYGGKVKVADYDGEIFSGTHELRIGAVDRKTSNVLAETSLTVVVSGGAEPKKTEAASTFVLTNVLDRETAAEFFVNTPDGDWRVDPASLYAIDENGRRKSFSPLNVKTGANRVIFDKLAVEKLRVVRADLSHGKRKVNVVLRLISSPLFLEKMRKEAARPMFPSPWSEDSQMIEISVDEELPIGHVVAVLPAVVPTTKKTAPVSINGEMQEAFELDSETGLLTIKNRIDYESLSENQRKFDLELISGEEAFESKAVLKFLVSDVDDQPPVIQDDLFGDIDIREDLPRGTVVANLSLTDTNAPQGFIVTVDGRGKDSYEAIADSGRLIVRMVGSLDREKETSHAIIVTVRDAAGNSDQILLPINILDVNDHSPELDREFYEVSAMDGWPEGVVLDKITATDNDIEEAGRVTYSIEQGELKMFAINETTGVLISAAEMFGMATDEPQILRVVASDNGEPPRNTSTTIKVHVRSSMTSRAPFEFTSPVDDFVLNLERKTPKPLKVFTATAKTARGRPNDSLKPKFAIKDLIENTEAFKIDEFTGDVFFESQKDEPGELMLGLEDSAESEELLEGKNSTESSLARRICPRSLVSFFRKFGFNDQYEPSKNA
ncbi:unnamed protein product [Caenorhabditis auriculariae]|uniref:Cadherin domain-containing protein n=1 Tax=Caenorhabditis auriculariae TaxID=2777116 RepID=A0A8S1HYX0_9PELO|nr:unnamed protein product [Caenorhabditis auriculariae]